MEYYGVQKKRDQASKNRKGEVVGSGKGPPTHSGGSRSAIDHGIQLAKELNRPVTDYEIFEKMHKKKNGEFVDKRSKDVSDEVIKRHTEATQNLIEDGENSSATTDWSTTYYGVVGPQKKQRVYGLGCKPSAGIPACSTSKSTPFERDQLRAEIYEEVREEMRHIQEEIEQEMRQKQEQIELELRQKQEKMEDLMQRFMTGGRTSSHPTDLCATTEDDDDEDYHSEDQ